ncbi:MAG: hypothetical protein OXG78_05555 [Chloroflexi bacterium]|nr:hypothetical protein [Chloroflexota bacterium]
MNRSKADFAWNLLSFGVAEILMPLQLITAALFVSVGYILTLLMPLNIDIWAALLVLSILLPLMPLTMRARRLWRHRQLEAARFSWRCLLPFFPLLLILPPVIALLALPSLDAVAHMDLQFPFISQVFHRESPYESVIVPGNPTNQYWLYFVFVAAIVRVSSLDVYSVWVLTNLTFILATQFWIARTLLALKLARKETLRLGLLILFCFCAINLTGILSVLSHALNGLLDPGRLDLMLLDGADYRLHTMISTVVHGRGLTPGITTFAAALFLLLNFLRDRFDLSSFVQFSAAGLIALAFMPTLAFFIVVALLGALVLTALYSLVNSSERIGAAVAYARAITARISPSSILLWVLVSLILALPLLKYIDDFSSGIQSSISFVLFYPTNIRMVLASIVLLLPIAGLQFVHALRSRQTIQCFLGFSAIIGLLLCLTLSATHDNQYKFHYVTAMLLALLTLHSVYDRRIGSKTGSSMLGIFVNTLVILALLNAVYGSHRFVLKRVTGQRTARFEGIHAESIDPFGGRVRAFQWIRDNTPHDAIIIVGHVYTPKSKLLHERLNYVSKGGKLYSDYLPGYDQRIEALHTFYGSNTTIDQYLDLLESMQTQLPGRPLYAVVMDPELSRDTMAQRGAQIVFENPPYGAHVYFLNPQVAR